MGRENRAAWHVSAWRMLLVYGLVAGLLVTALAGRTTTYLVESGDYGDLQTLVGWQPPQPVGAGLGRWSTPQATIRWPNLPGQYTLMALHLIAPDPPGATLPTTITIGTDQVVLAVPPSSRRYLVFLPTGDAILKTPIGLASVPAGAEIGVGLSTVQWTHQRDWATTLGIVLSLLAASGLGSYTLSRVWPRWWYAIGPALGALLLAAMINAWPAATGMICALALGVSISLALLARQTRRTAHPQWWWSLGAIVAGAALLRFVGLGWDAGYGFHPDEWVFARASQQLQPPWNPHFFAYGSLLLYLYRISAAILSGFDPAWLTDLGHYLLIGRWYSALWGTLTVITIAVLGARWQSRRVGLLAALLWAGATLAIQQAHFATTDSFLTLLFSLIAYGCMRYAAAPTWRNAALIGALLGAGFATKVTASLFVIMPLALVAGLLRDKTGPHLALRALLRHAAVCFGSAIGACIVFAPYYLLAWNEFWQALAVEQQDATSALADYTYQFIDTPAYIYQLLNLAWTCGPALIAVAGVGWLWVGWRGKRLSRANDLLLWLAPTIYFLAIGLSFTKYNRYLLPILPFVCLYAATTLDWLAQGPGWRRNAGRWLGVATAGLTLGYGLLFGLGVYGRPDPRLVASEWIYQHIPPGQAIITAEEHDVFLPVAYGGLTANMYSGARFNVYAPETRESPAYYADVLGTKEYLIIASRSQHLPFRHNPALFPVRSCVYTALFDGSLGWQEIQRFSRGPTLLGRRLDPEHQRGIEETFQVFDHPTVLIFARTPQYSSALLSQRLAACAAAN